MDLTKLELEYWSLRRSHAMAELRPRLEGSISRESRNKMIPQKTTTTWKKTALGNQMTMPP